MPIIKSAVKRMKQTSVRRARNVETKKAVKAATRAFTDKPSSTTLSEAQSAIDTAVKKNVIGKGTAARRKSNLARIAKDAGVKLETGKKKAAGSKKPTAVKKPAAKAPAAKKAPVKKPAAKKPTVKKS